MTNSEKKLQLLNIENILNLFNFMQDLFSRYLLGRNFRNNKLPQRSVLPLNLMTNTK